MKSILLIVALETELPRDLVSNDSTIYYCGVGKVNAAITATSLMSTLAIMGASHDITVINYGSAGGPAELVNTLIRCTRFAQGDIDCRPFVDKGITPYDADELKGELVFGTDGMLVTTYDQFQLEPDGIVDMEAYAIAKVCKRFGVPFISYKWVSDNGNPDDWKENHNKGIPQFLEELTKI